MDKNLKNIAYEVLVENLKEVEPNATKESVVKKINSIRSNFRRELKRHNESKRSGAGEDDIYKTNLWYFDDLLFLCDHEEPRPSTSNLTWKDITIEEIEDVETTEDVILRGPKKRANSDKVDAVLESIQKHISGF